MKKLLTLLLAMLLCVACCMGLTACGGDDNGDGEQNNAKPVLYVYTNSGFAPYEYLSEDGKVVGVDMDIMEEIGEVLGYKIEVRDIDFEQILNEVSNNAAAVGAAGMTQNPDRDQIALASISYATSVQYAIVPAGTFTSADLVDGKLPLTKLATLSNKKIGTQTGTTGYYMVDGALAAATEEDPAGELFGTGASVFTYKNAILASQDIGSSIGSVVIDKLPAQSICEANANLECFELDAEPESYVLYFNKNATALVAKVNAVLEVMIENGVIDYFTIKHSGGIA